MKKSGRKEETIHSRLRSCRAHKNFIRWVVLGVFLLCAVCIVYPFSPRNEQPAGSVKMVVLLPGEIDDQSWNTGNYKGIMECRKALDVELRYEKMYPRRIRKRCSGGMPTRDISSSWLRERSLKNRFPR